MNFWIYGPERVSAIALNNFKTDKSALKEIASVEVELTTFGSSWTHIEGECENEVLTNNSTH